MKLLDEHACKREILERLARVRPDSPRRWGKMTAPQMICHLSDSFRSVMGERPLTPMERYPLPRKLVKWIALNMPMKWPHGAPTRPENTQGIGGGGTPPAEFEADRRVLAGAIERFTNAPRSYTFAPHPLFLEMTIAEWMRWGYLHMDHHLRQFGA